MHHSKINKTILYQVFWGHISYYILSNLQQINVWTRSTNLSLNCFMKLPVYHLKASTKKKKSPLQAT